MSDVGVVEAIVGVPKIWVLGFFEKSISLSFLERFRFPPCVSAYYCVKSSGFSEERTLLSSKHALFRSSKNQDSVVAFLKKHGFSDAQISRLVRKSPTMFNLCRSGHFFNLWASLMM